jgi:nucleotide-binding universal stress UspA family protein
MFEVIVCATDGSEHGDRALAFARRLCEARGSTLRVLHVTTVLPGGAPVHGDAERRIGKCKAQVNAMRRHEDEAFLHVIRGALPGQAPGLIAEFARQVGADLIVIGSRGRAPRPAAARGSVTASLLRLGECPVLGVPRRAAAPGAAAAA